MTLEQIIGATLFFVLAVILLTCALVALVKHYGIVQQNEELREYVAFSETRRRRAMQYMLDTVCRHDQEYIEYAVAKQFGLVAPPPQAEQTAREARPLNIHYSSPPPRRQMPPPRTQNFRQSEPRYEPPPEPRERVVFVHEPYREPPPRKRLPFWSNDDDIIDVTPEPPRHHRAMPQVLLLGAPRNKGGQPRKHSSNAARQSAYRKRKKEKKS